MAKKKIPETRATYQGVRYDELTRRLVLQLSWKKGEKVHDEIFTLLDIGDDIKDAEGLREDFAQAIDQLITEMKKPD